MLSLKTVIINIIVFLLLVSCRTAPQSLNGNDWCKTRYPIVLVHGIAMLDKTLVIDYWKDIPEHLQANGASVYLSGQKAYATHDENARLIKTRVLEILEKEGAEKINIIGISKGGIESRYMISMLDMGSRVASLTTICTPHRGSSLSDYIFENMEEKKETIAIMHLAASVCGVIIGEERPEPYDAGIELTTWNMKKFNEAVKDDKRVYYQSYASSISESYPSSIWVGLYKELYKREGPNDGIVSVESAKWGTYKGIITTPNHPELSHADVLNTYEITGIQCNEIYDFYIDLVHELKEMGL